MNQPRNQHAFDQSKAGHISDAPEGLVLWDRLEGHTFPVLQASFAPDRAFVVSTDGQDLRLWTWNKRHHLVFDRIVETAPEQLAISYESQWIASIERKRPFPNHIHLWSASGELVRPYGRVNPLAPALDPFSPFVGFNAPLRCLPHSPCKNLNRTLMSKC